MKTYKVTYERGYLAYGRPDEEHDLGEVEASSALEAIRLSIPGGPSLHQNWKATEIPAGEGQPESAFLSNPETGERYEEHYEAYCIDDLLESGGAR